MDAYDNPDVSSDLAEYRSTFGLGKAKFAKYNQQGQKSNYPQGNAAWGVGIDEDVEMVSASCPLCIIYLVEANSDSWNDLETAEAEAVTLGAHIVSNSYEGSGANQSFYDTKGVTYLASTDGGLTDPADFDSVVAVGGTTLTKGGGGKRGWTEAVWVGATGGCSTQPKPPWQHDKTCAYRQGNDVSAAANNVAVYDSYDYGGWLSVAGTVVATPFLSGVFALAGNATKQDGGRTFWLNAHHKHLYRVEYKNAYVRYSQPGGWGSPDGVKAF